MNNLNPVDTALQTAVPTIMVPRCEPFEPLVNAGHRFLACANGLWLEVRQAWLYLVMPLSLQSKVPMTYGSVSQTAVITSVPADLIKAFQEFAREQLPYECAAHIILNIETGVMRLQFLKQLSAGRGHVDVQIDPLPATEVLVLDIHSHGFYDPFFSSKDNDDDKNGVKVAGVISFARNSPDTPNAALRCRALFRLCINGVYLAIQPRCEDNLFHFTVGEDYGTSATR